MDELNGRRVAKLGVDRTAAGKAVGSTIELALGALRADATSGARRATETSHTNSISGSKRVASGGVFVVGICSLVRETAGENAVGQYAGAAPGLGQYV